MVNRPFIFATGLIAVLPLVAVGDPTKDIPWSVAGQERVRLRYLLPDQKLDLKSSAKRWGLAAPVVNGFSDPNQIVYDEAYVRAYAFWAFNDPIRCGSAQYTVATPQGPVTFHGGADECYLGRNFRAEDLMKFLQARASGKTVKRTFRVDDARLAKSLGKKTTSGRRLSASPWDRDTRTVLTLIVKAKYKPVYPILKSLMKDRSYPVRSMALTSLGAMASVVPDAIKDIKPWLEDKELQRVAVQALCSAGRLAAPVLIQAMDHKDSGLRNAVVHNLAWMPLDGAVPALVAGLRHKREDVQEWSAAVVLDLHSRGTKMAQTELRKALAYCLLNGNDDARRRAAIVLKEMNPVPVEAKSALVKAAAEDRSSQVRKYAQEALESIRAVEGNQK